MVKGTEEMKAIGAKGIDSALELTRLTMESAERLMRLQLEVGRMLVEDNVKNARAMVEVKDPAQVDALRARLAGDAVERAVDYSQRLYELAAETQGAVAKLMESRITGMHRDVVSALEESMKSTGAPEPMLAAFRGSVLSANAAVEAMTRATKQLSEMAETNVKASAKAAAETARKAVRRKS